MKTHFKKFKINIQNQKHLLKINIKNYHELISNSKSKSRMISRIKIKIQESRFLPIPDRGVHLS